MSLLWTIYSVSTYERSSQDYRHCDAKSFAWRNRRNMYHTHK
ncbi:hypothetical protein OIU79_029482 [Salix purpurea]|uniref:Uncharacterized protein n=1 Tax=Salix purpurea TaxID=77065 RepID=A0A9Q0ZVT1_SALPP|nr:hypothetical protein OIU79_029482 [Salix purpurea]